MDKRIDTVSCGALPWRVKAGKAQVLLIKQFHNRERWGVPKGHVEPGEEHEACAIREVFEETGLHVKLEARLPEVAVSARHERKTVITWLAQVEGPDDSVTGDPKSEVADARWFDVSALPEIVAYQRVLVADASRGIIEMVSRGLTR